MIEKDIEILDKNDTDELCDLYKITIEDLDCISKFSIKDEILELTLDWEDMDELLLKIISIPKFRKFVETELNSDTIVRFPMVEDELDKNYYEIVEKRIKEAVYCENYEE